GGTRRLLSAAQFQPARRDPDVEVRLGSSGEMREDVVLADQVGDRLVHVVVPAGTRFGDTDLAVLLQAHKKTVPENVLEDPVVASQPADGDRGLGAHPVELAAFQEVDVLLRLKQSGRIHVTTQWRAGSNPDQPTCERLPAEVASNRDAVMAILYEVDVAEVIHLDG